MIHIHIHPAWCDYNCCTACMLGFESQVPSLLLKGNRDWLVNWHQLWQSTHRAILTLSSLSWAEVTSCKNNNTEEKNEKDRWGPKPIRCIFQWAMILIHVFDSNIAERCYSCSCFCQRSEYVPKPATVFQLYSLVKRSLSSHKYESACPSSLTGKLETHILCAMLTPHVFCIECVRI